MHSGNLDTDSACYSKTICLFLSQTEPWIYYLCQEVPHHFSHSSNSSLSTKKKCFLITKFFNTYKSDVKYKHIVTVGPYFGFPSLGTCDVTPEHVLLAPRILSCFQTEMFSPVYIFRIYLHLNPHLQWINIILWLPVETAPFTG